MCSDCIDSDSSSELNDIEVDGKVSTEFSKFIWEIDVDSFKGKTVLGECLRSPPFATINTGSKRMSDEWYLKLYPKGEMKEDKGHVSLFLHKYTGDSVRVSVSFSFLDRNKQRVNFITSYNKSQKSKVWGLPRFSNEKFIMEPQNCIVKNKKFKIWCKISFEESPSSKNSRIHRYRNSNQRFNQLDNVDKLLTAQSDITVIAERKKLYLHKSVLCANSNVFKAMLNTEMKEKNEGTIFIEDIQFCVLQELFRYMYTGKVHKMTRLVCELLVAAEKYDIKGLKLLCEETMAKDLDSNNVLEYLNLAMENNADQLKTAAIERITMILENLVQKQEFHLLGMKYPELLIQIMQKYVGTAT